MKEKSQADTVTNMRTQDRTGSWEKIKCRKMIDYRIDESTGITALFYVLRIHFLSKIQLQLAPLQEMCLQCISENTYKSFIPQ